MSETTQIVEASAQEKQFLQAVEGAIEINQMETSMVKSLRMAKVVKELRKCLDLPEIMETIKFYHNKPIGFVTDKMGWDGKKNQEKVPYKLDVIKDCVMEATMQGANIFGNEFNIIASRTYFTQSFFVRKLRELSAITGLEYRFDDKVPVNNGKVGYQNVYKCECTVNYRIAGQEAKQKKLIYNLVGQTDDQVLGKLKKRTHQWLFNEITNSNLGMVPDDSEFVEAEGSTIVEEAKLLDVDALLKHAESQGLKKAAIEHIAKQYSDIPLNELPSTDEVRKFFANGIKEMVALNKR